LQKTEEWLALVDDFRTLDSVLTVPELSFLIKKPQLGNWGTPVATEHNHNKEVSSVLFESVESLRYRNKQYDFQYDSLGRDGPELN
jgi:hypothetical protein